jgi:hypothetical protein
MKKEPAEHVRQTAPTEIQFLGDMLQVFQDIITINLADEQSGGIAQIYDKVRRLTGLPCFPFLSPSLLERQCSALKHRMFLWQDG